MSAPTIKEIKENDIENSENNIDKNIEIIFQNSEKTAGITLEGQGNLKVLTVV